MSPSSNKHNFHIWSSFLMKQMLLENLWRDLHFKIHFWLLSRWANFTPYLALWSTCWLELWPSVTSTFRLYFCPFKLHWNQDAKIFLMVWILERNETLQFSLKISTGSFNVLGILLCFLLFYFIVFSLTLYNSINFYLFFTFNM